jgi:hypothetical protein
MQSQAVQVYTAMLADGTRDNEGAFVQINTDQGV